MKTKKDMLYSFHHTQERLEERYGIEINAMDYAEMCENIIHKRHVLFITSEKQKKDVQEIYDVYLRSTLVRVVWSKVGKCIKTVLPMIG
jgi:hypothetical protein